MHFSSFALLLFSRHSLSPMTIVSLYYLYHQLRMYSAAEIKKRRQEKAADYLISFPRKCEKGFEFVLDGTPENDDPKEGDCLGPYVQRVLSTANTGAPSIPIVQNLEEQNVEFCWKTTTDLGRGRYRMYLRTKKIIKAKDRLELLTKYGASHILNQPSRVAKAKSGTASKRK